jgi:hypothetical protein
MSKQKINKDILELNSTFNKIDLVGFYRVFQPTTADYILFSAAMELFPK